jgi:hypothetical protein
MSGDTPVIEDGPYPVTVDVSPFVPPSVSVTGFNVPLKAYAGMAVDCSVSGHVDVAGGNPCVGLMYVDGPASSINIDGSVIGKGQAKVFGYTSFKDACTNIDFKGSVVYPVAGTYKLGVISGYIDVLGGIVHTTSRGEVSVDVELALANVSGRVVESLLFGLIKRPSSGAKVSLDSLKFVYTGDDGAYSLADVPLGTYKVSVRKPFFEGKTSEISLTEAGKTYSLDFEIGISKWVNYGVVAGAFVVPLLALVLAKR